jgi:hypothetical protein
LPHRCEGYSRISGDFRIESLAVFLQVLKNLGQGAYLKKGRLFYQLGALFAWGDSAGRASILDVRVDERRRQGAAHREIHRMLKSGGWFALTEIARGYKDGTLLPIEGISRKR